MPRGALSFKKRDVEAAVAAVLRAGCDVARIEVDRSGKIVIVTRSEHDRSQAQVPNPEANPWDAE